MCVLNGRFGLKSNYFTSISARGKAVVDYVAIPHEQLNNVENFEIIMMNDVGNLFKHHLSDKCKYPDHSILCTTVNMSFNIMCNSEPSLTISSSIVTDHKTLTVTKYRFDEIPNTFMHNEHWENKVAQFNNSLYVLSSQNASCY